MSAEYLYNGAGREDAATTWALLAEGHVQHVSEHVGGLLLAYELTPLLHVSLATMVAIDDPSVLVQPGFVYSAADEVDILAGAMLAFGERPALPAGDASLSALAAGALGGSEFGTYPHVFYLEMKAYF